MSLRCPTRNLGPSQPQGGSSSSSSSSRLSPHSRQEDETKRREISWSHITEAQNFQKSPGASRTGRASHLAALAAKAWEGWVFPELRHPPHTPFCALIARGFHVWSHIHVQGRGSFLGESEARTQLTLWCRVCTARRWRSDYGIFRWLGAGGCAWKLQTWGECVSETKAAHTFPRCGNRWISTSTPQPQLTGKHLFQLHHIEGEAHSI